MSSPLLVIGSAAVVAFVGAALALRIVRRDIQGVPSRPGRTPRSRRAGDQPC